MAVAHVQNVATATATATLPGATTPGNFLVCILAHRGTAVTAGPTSTHGTWSLAASLIHPTDNLVSEIWYRANLSGTSTTITVPSIGNDIAVVAEYSGVGIVQAVDRTATNSGNSAAPDTGTTATTQKATELWIGTLATSRGNGVYSAPTNSFILRNQLGEGTPSNGATGALLDRFVTATGTANTGATLAPAADTWTGAIATFYGKETESVTATISGTSSVSSTLHRVRKTTGTVAAASTVSATVRRRRRTTASVPAASTVSASMLAVQFMEASIASSSSLTESMDRTRGLSSTIAASAVISETMHLIRDLAALLSGASDLAAVLDVISSELVVTSVSPVIVEGIPGEKITLFGTFPVGVPVLVYVGPTGTSNDEQAYPGVSGQGYTFYPTRPDQLKIFLPFLEPGIYRIHAETPTSDYTLVNALTTRPKQFRTSVFALKSILPSKWKLGPRNLENEP